MPVEPQKPARSAGGHSKLLRGSGTALNHFLQMYFLIRFFLNVILVMFMLMVFYVLLVMFQSYVLFWCQEGYQWLFAVLLCNQPITGFHV